MSQVAASHEERSPDPADSELAARIRAGDDAAFEQLFITYYEGMCALADTFVRSRQAAEDIVGNVFRKLWLRRHEWRPRGSARSYLLTATRNEAISLLRRYQRERGLAQEVAREKATPALGTPAARPDDAMAARELGAAIERAIAELPPRCREVFVLHWREGLRHREIAKRMGISVKTIEIQMTRALRSLRERLRDQL